jgi:hypothetical protein
LAQQILGSLLADFLEQKLDSDSLRNGYVGASLPALAQQYRGSGSASQVDFDLALKQLENGKLVNTGPMEFYNNPPGSHAVIIAMFSKREYAYLTEEGYRATQQCKTVSRPTSRPMVHISGGTFHQSPIGIGDHVTQSVTVSAGELTEDVRKLIDQLEQLLPTSGLPSLVREDSQAALTELREAAALSTPDVSRLRRGLESLKHVMEHATGHVVATGVLALIAQLLSRAAN